MLLVVHLAVGAMLNILFYWCLSSTGVEFLEIAAPATH